MWRRGRYLDLGKFEAVYTETHVRQTIDELATRIANQAYDTSEERSRLVVLAEELLVFRDAMEDLLEWERTQQA